MAQLLVRNLDDALVQALKLRAARRGHSAEAEHREILRSALEVEAAPPSFKQFLLAMPEAGPGDVFDIPRDLPRDVDE
jgi:antitoxin FitA